MKELFLSSLPMFVISQASYTGNHPSDAVSGPFPWRENIAFSFQDDLFAPSQGGARYLPVYKAYNFMPVGSTNEKEICHFSEQFESFNFYEF